MIFGLELHVFFAFLSWPVTYTIIAIIMYFVMAKHALTTIRVNRQASEKLQSMCRDREKKQN
ncbi:MAG: hypothetical protein Q4D99_07415 [Bacillota bacterium]|nr:hypothetical protein [Bacillota bacterium]